MDVVFQGLLLFLENDPGKMRARTGNGPVFRAGDRIARCPGHGQDYRWNYQSKLEHRTLPARARYLTQAGTGVCHATESGTYYY